MIDLEQLLDDAAAGVRVGPAPDPGVLRARAGVSRHRRGVLVLVGVAAAVAATVIGVTLVTGPKETRDPGRTPPSPAGHPTPTVTDADNRRAAQAAATRLSNAVPLPTGARRLPGEPADWPQGGQGMSPSDPSLEQVSWYTVPGSLYDLQGYLLDHPPAGMSDEDGGVGVSGSIRTYSYMPAPQQDGAAYRGPWLLVDWANVNGTTTVRFDVMIVSRHARTAATYLAGTVSSVDIDRTVQRSLRHEQTIVLPTIHLSAQDDGTQLDRIVSAVNALHGTVISHSIHTCPPFENDSYRFVFHTSEGDVTYDWPPTSSTPTCDPEIDVTRDGVRLSPALDPGNLETIVPRILGSGVGNGRQLGLDGQLGRVRGREDQVAGDLADLLQVLGRG